MELQNAGQQWVLMIGDQLRHAAARKRLIEWSGQREVTGFSSGRNCTCAFDVAIVR